MRHTLFSTAALLLPGLTARWAAADDQATDEQQIRRPGFLAALVSALHHTRRLQAQRTLLQYRHLFARYGEVPSRTAPTEPE